MSVKVYLLKIIDKDRENLISLPGNNIEEHKFVNIIVTLWYNNRRILTTCTTAAPGGN